MTDRAVLAANPGIGQELLDLDQASASVDDALRAVEGTLHKDAGIREFELKEMTGEPSLRDRIRSRLPEVAK
jgi:hypothetical protein